MLDEHTLKLLIASTEPPKSLDPRAADWTKLEHYAAKDFWGTNGEYWRGRRPKTTGLDEVKKLFTANDRINPGVNRFVDATVGRDPEWDAIDTTATTNKEGSVEPNTALEQLETDLTTWHVDSAFHAELKRFHRHALIYGKASLKVYIPDVYADLVEAASLPAALEFIHVLALTPREAGTYRDTHNRILAHWHKYTITTPENPALTLLEVQTPEDITTYKLDGVTATMYTEPLLNPLFDPNRKRRPRFMLYEITLDEGGIFSTPLLDMQDSLNEAWVNLKRNDQLAGYRSIITLNAADPTDNDGNPIPWTFGPARVQSLQGVVTKGSEETPEGIATPDVIIVDPVNPLQSSIPTINAYIEAILEDLDQLWTRPGAQASAESKRESRKAFDKRVITGAGTIVHAMRWALETVLALAAFIQRAPAEYQSIRINPKLFLDVERGNLELFKVLVDAYKDNLVSLETLVSANPGVEDQSAELERLAVPPRLTPALADAALKSGRLSRLALLKQQGYSDVDAAQIAKDALQESTMAVSGPPSPGSQGTTI